MKGDLYTEEQDSWLRAYAPAHSRKDTAEAFNARFNDNRSEFSIKVRCNKHLHIHFLGDRRKNRSLPIGTERIRSGYRWVKVSDNIPSDGQAAAYTNWKQKSQIVYEDAYGSIPDGYLVVFLNRNTLDCRPENLYAVSPKVNREMSKKNWWSEDPRITLAAIKWCELFYTIKDVL